MDDDLDGVLFNIRACIVSSKGAVPIRDLMRDYETLVGSKIPYRNFNYDTLENFLRSLHSLRVFVTGKDVMVDADVDRSSSHISSLVAKQKPAKKSNYGPPRRGPPLTRSYGKARGNPSKSYGPRESGPRDSYQQQRKYSNNTYTPQQYREQSNNFVEPVGPLVVKVDGNEKRQVSMGDSSLKKSSHKPAYELPPRLKRAQNREVPQPEAPSLPSPTASHILQSLDDRLYVDQSKSIISAFGPSELMAVGRAKKQAEQYTQLQEFYQDTLGNGLQVQTNFTTRIRELFDMDRLQVNDESNSAASIEQFDQLGSFPVASDLQIDLGSSQSLLEPLMSPCVPAPDITNIHNNINLLLQYTISAGWPEPVYNFLKRQPKGGNRLYGATVTVGDPGHCVKKYSSYPEEGGNEGEASALAATVALKKLFEEEKVKNSKKKIISDNKIIGSRVREIVAGSYNGMFANMVEDKYTEKYMESLPDDWLHTLSNCPTVSVESTINNVIILPKDPINSVEPLPTLPLPTPSLQPLEIPQLDQLGVYITHATSTDNVWFRLIGDEYNEEYTELKMKMDSYYITNDTVTKALIIGVGQYYAGKCEDGWFRVCVSEVKDESKMVSAWFLDHGDNDEIPFSNLYTLPSEFCVLPIQAVQCCLEGLEKLSEDPVAKKIIFNNVVDKTFIAKITNTEAKSEILKVVLYDTSTNEDINFNEKLLEIIENAKNKPELPHMGCAKEVVVSHISKSGEVFLQMPGPPLDSITDVVSSLGDEEISKHKLKSYREVVLNKMYMARYNKDDSWYRAVVTATPSIQQNKIAVQFVDYGNMETVSISDIADVSNLPPVISSHPPQAIKVALHNLPSETLTLFEIAKLHVLLIDEDDKVVLAKTVQLDLNPPVVQIFYKNDNQELVSVDSTIESKRTVLRHGGMNDSNPNEMLTFKNGFGNFMSNLKKPDLGDQCLQVLITLAASPGNFIFQPMKYYKELNTMMRELQLYYEYASSQELTKNDIVKGSLYAARHTGDIWYRAIVTEDVIGSKVFVRLCDFGDMVPISASHLRDLDEDFRIMPFMAVKGKLAGVVPAHTDWSVEDCIRFQQLVVGMELTAEITHMVDSDDPMELVVTMKLFDLSSENNLRIEDILIKENRAVKEKC